IEAERLETERIEAERLEAERLEAERLEAERIEAERIEAERLEAERLEAERLEAERIEAERLEAERLEAERLEAERLEAERIEAERLETERIEAERIEAERLEAERLEAERIETERLETERLQIVIVDQRAQLVGSETSGRAEVEQVAHQELVSVVKEFAMVVRRVSEAEKRRATVLVVETEFANRSAVEREEASLYGGLMGEWKAQAEFLAWGDDDSEWASDGRSAPVPAMTSGTSVANTPARPAAIPGSAANTAMFSATQSSSPKRTPGKGWDDDWEAWD
ncbi:Hypothetical protein, putative, partial [Bodo saltans]